MKIDPPLQSGKLIKRYKRFFADIQLPDGDVMTIHCPNTGSMKNCNLPGQPVWYSLSDNPKRKLKGTWEMIETVDNDFIGVNTGRANRLVEEAIINGVITEFEGFTDLKREARLAHGKSRMDFLFYQGETPCYVEVKNVTLHEGDGRGYFPDAVTERGTKHLHELIDLKKQGARAVLLFCVQHTGIKTVAPAEHIDPVYSKTLQEAIDNGVEVIAYSTKLTPDEIILESKIPLAL